MEETGGQMQLVASQATVNVALVPCTIGWCIQLYLCGVSTDRARRILYHRKYQETKASGVPGTRYFLIAALFMNFAYTIVTIWDIVVWVTDQDRTDAGVNGLKTPDLVGPFMGGLVGIIVPSFMAVRCWRITNRSLIFAISISSLLLLSLAALLWVLISSVQFHNGEAGDEPLFAPNQIWLCTSAVVDTVITVCLMLHLRRMKRGFNTSTDNFLDSLVRLAFETSFPPALISVAAAIIYACTWKTEFAWNTYYCLVPFIPSLYLLSFVYCLQGTRARGRILSSSNGPALSDQANRNEKNKNTQERNAAIPLSQIQSWSAPIDWHSSFQTSGELESFQSQKGQKPSQPFSDYARSVSFTAGLPETAESPSNESEPSIKAITPTNPVPPKLHIRITTESEVTIEEGGDLERQFTPVN